MKSIAITIFILLVVVILGLLFFSYQVRETESALLMRFGKPIRQITAPGWYFKWPEPIEDVEKFDSRMRILEADVTETPTKGATPIIVNTYVVWKIAEPLQFFNALGTVMEAESKLRSQISNTQNEVIGRYEFSEFVNSNKSKIKFDQIQAEMLGDLQQAVREDYGIEIKTLGIKRLKVSEDVSEAVFKRMRAERNRKTEGIISEGKAAAITIRGDADSIETQLLAAADARAAAIKGRGDAEAAKYYKMLEADPELAMYLRDLEALKKILAKRSTIVFSADMEPFRLLKEIPHIKLKDPNESK